jgi:Tubulin-tyrosine ligase family
MPDCVMLPRSLFVEEFKRCPNAAWIMKPTNRAQGKGIFIIKKLAQVRGNYHTSSQTRHILDCCGSLQSPKSFSG